VNRWILFTVRTHLDRIDSFDASTAKALHDAIRGTDPDELEYKSLGDDKLAAVVTEFWPRGPVCLRRLRLALTPRTRTRRCTKELA
jgi:hypothetical protein